MSEENFKIWYTARNLINRVVNRSTWDKFIDRTKLRSTYEVVTLDEEFSELTFQPDIDLEFDNIVFSGNQVTSYFNSLDYVIKKSQHIDYFDLFAVVKEPAKIKQIQLENEFVFIGYDFNSIKGTRAFVNSDNLGEVIKPNELNYFGLITDYDRARQIQNELRESKLNEHYAEYHMFAIWRHKYIGRNSFHVDFFSYKLGSRISDVLDTSDDRELKGWWCDGIDLGYVEKKYINDKRQLTTIGWFGKGGSIKFHLTIYFGKYSLRRFAKGTSMIDCIPSNSESDWIEVDLNKKEIFVSLK